MSIGQTTFTYTYEQLCDLRTWMTVESSMTEAVYGFMDDNHLEASDWIYWLRLAQRIQVDWSLPEFLFPACRTSY